MKKFFLDSDIDEIIERLDTKAKLEGKTILMSGARGFLGRYFMEIFKKMNQNHFKKPVKIIEAQLGSILKETDIVRYQDIYGRVKE